jgi:putative ABC transport system substrate-binding protein
MTTRRKLLQALGASLTVWPLVGGAQTARKVDRIGILNIGMTADYIGPQPKNPIVNEFLRRLRELGYVYGENFVTEARGDEGRPERFPELAVELVRLNVDVIVAGGIALPALKKATSTIPVVMAASPDPVSQGFVRSLNHPGGNFTGMSLQSAETTGKRLELLKELVPGTAPVAVLWERNNSLNWQEAEAAAGVRGWKLLSLEIRDAGDIERAFATATGARAGAMLVFGGGLFFAMARQIAELAIRSRLPTMYELRPYVDAGGLLSYGADIYAIWRQAAGFVDKILKGAKPGDLPIEQPTKFELVVNMKTARALGLAIPSPLLVRADEVIQ